jgi:hypothetical protein
MLGLVVGVFAFRYIFGPIEGLVTYALLPEELVSPLFRTIFRL